MIMSNASSNFSATKLVSGILSDLQDLMSQQIALIKAECLADWQKTKEAGFILWFSLVPVASGTILLAFMFAHLLHWLTMPSGSDPASLPLWACYGIVGGTLTATGALLFFMGLRKLQAVNPLRGESVQSLGDNLRWLEGAAIGKNRIASAARDEWPAPGKGNSHAP